MATTWVLREQAGLAQHVVHHVLQQYSQPLHCGVLVAIARLGFVKTLVLRPVKAQCKLLVYRSMCQTLCDRRCDKSST